MSKNRVRFIAANITQAARPNNAPFGCLRTRGASTTIRPMDELQAWITTWLDPRVVGEAVMDWSGRIFAALVIFIVGRMLMRGLTT